jgi:hypothetical protein
MPDFPDTAAKVRRLALGLVQFLKTNIEDTHDRRDWTERNLELLRRFAADYDAASFPSEDGGEFLWDFIAYVKERGILLAAESEHDKNPGGIDHDFEKLLYVGSPLKLMMCRMKSEADAESIRQRLYAFMKSTCCEYSTGEAYILYCVWWAGHYEHNRDRAFILQIPGEPTHVAMGDVEFQAV